MTIIGTNFASTAALMRVEWNGVLVSSVQVVVPYEVFSFTTPPSVADACQFTLSVAGQAAEQGHLGRVAIKAPSIVSLLLDIRSFSGGFTCSRSPVSTSGLNVTLRVSGDSFGSGSMTSAFIGGAECAIDRSRSSHSELFVVTNRCFGPLTVVVGARTSSAYDYQFDALVASPILTSVSPSSGPTAGGTLVTIVGTRMQFDGVVTFVSQTGVAIGQCDWKSAGEYTPTFIRYRQLFSPARVFTSSTHELLFGARQVFDSSRRWSWCCYSCRG